MACDLTFCKTDQTVGGNSGIKFSFSDASKQNIINKGLIDSDAWNEIINEVQAIYDYGSYGTRNPSIDSNYKTDNLKEEYLDYINLSDYNNLLTTLSLETSKLSESESNIIYGSYFSQLETDINNYKLNTDRCDSCNTCNSCDTGLCDCDYSICYSGNATYTYTTGGCTKDNSYTYYYAGSYNPSCGEGYGGSYRDSGYYGYTYSYSYNYGKGDTYIW